MEDKDLELEQQELSFAQLVKEITTQELLDFTSIKAIVDKFEFVESQETTYNNLRLSIYFKQLPAISGANLLVKAVVLVQGESIAIIVPKNVADIYIGLQENPDAISSKNVNLELYGEVFGFDVKDASFKEIIKTAYLSAGNSLMAFEFKNPEEEESKSKKDEEEDKEDRPNRPLGNIDDIPDDAPIEDAPDFEPPFEKIATKPSLDSALDGNMESFNKFKRTGKYLDKVLASLAEAPAAIKNNTRYQFLGENRAVLLIEVDNKAILERFKTRPQVAKKALSTHGESIRNAKNAQLIDSFILDGKRYHILAESVGNNFWFIENEKLVTVTEEDVKGDIIVPIKEQLIKLKSSSVRQESRKYVPVLLKDTVAFLGGK